ncbi:MAG TPA: MBL fold metallo-hydrolase [Acidimicrobiia bacterium]|jgi:flavorubredoxin
MRALQVNDDTTMFSSAVPIPMVGVLPVNAFLVKGEQPMLIDTGITPARDAFLTVLREHVDLADLRWLVLTHSDHDHVGAVSQLLAEAPHARVVATFATVGIMSVGADPIPPERALVVRDGSTVDVGDRTLSVHRPPLFDNPGTVAVFDPRQGVLFSADAFGGPLPTEEHALAEDVGSLDTDEVRAAQLLWGSFDSPWVHEVEPARFGASVARFVESKPDTVLSTHLPPIRGGLDRYVETLTMIPASAPTPLPDQEALEEFMAGFVQEL